MNDIAVFLIGIGMTRDSSFLVVDLRITQIVNGVRGVHARLPHAAIK